MKRTITVSSAEERANEPSAATPEPYRLTPKIYGVLGVTTMLTSATLVTGYQMLFSQQLFA
ncbi:MAG: hypothetical protein ABIO69_01235 [Sphingomicrobium sp.]